MGVNADLRKGVRSEWHCRKGRYELRQFVDEAKNAPAFHHREMKANLDLP